jgi:hypothetical protein
MNKTHATVAAAATICLALAGCMPAKGGSNQADGGSDSSYDFYYDSFRSGVGSMDYSQRQAFCLSYTQSSYATQAAKLPIYSDLKQGAYDAAWDVYAEFC